MFQTNCNPVYPLHYLSGLNLFFHHKVSDKSFRVSRPFWKIERKKNFVLFCRKWRRHAWRLANVKFFQKFSGYPKWFIWNFVMKKQIQSGQIIKRLEVFAACKKFVKFILATTQTHILHYFSIVRTLWFLKRIVILWTMRNGVFVLYLNKIHLHHILASGEKNTQSKSLNSAKRYPKKLHYAKPHYTSLVS